MIRGFYFDDNCSDTDVVRGVRSAGIFVSTSLDANLYGAEDPDHLEHAAASDLVVVTGDQKDFTRLNAQWLYAGRTHSGIVIIQQQRFDVRQQIRRLTRIYREAGEYGLRDRVEFLSKWPVADD